MSFRSVELCTQLRLFHSISKSFNNCLNIVNNYLYHEDAMFKSGLYKLASAYIHV